ncbi:42658_t:CDS:2, partial [Gigaspora margarita]
MAKILKYPGCDREIRTSKTRDLNKHMNLNGNLRKEQCQPALRLMQNPVGNPLIQRAQAHSCQNPAENPTRQIPIQNQVPGPEGNLDKNPPTFQPREVSVPALNPEIGSSVKEEFHTLSSKYYFIKANNKETVIGAYKRINEESEAIAEKTNSRIDMRKSENYTLTTIKFFKETTLAPKKSEKISEQENAWLNLASIGALVFAEKYEGEAIQYDVNSMYIYEMLNKEASWPIVSGKFHTINASLVGKWTKFPYGIYKATIKGNPPKKSLQCTRYLRYNLHGVYTHFDLEYMFGKWGNILYNIKKEGGIAEKVSKALLVSLWGALCEQRNGQNYGVHLRIKPFLLASARKRITEIVRPLGNQVKCIHTDGFIVAGQVNLKTGIEMSKLKFEKRGVCVVKNCILVLWKPSYPEIPNLADFEKIQQEQSTKLDAIVSSLRETLQTVKRKLFKKSDINLPNEIIIEIFQHLRIQNDRICGNNELCIRDAGLCPYNIRNFDELIKKKPLPNAIKYIKQIEFEKIDSYFNMNEFLLEDIISICQDIITISFKDCGWGFLNNSSLKITLDTYNSLELTMQEVITWKMIETAQINIIKEAFRLRYRKDSKLISEYAGY